MKAVGRAAEWQKRRGELNHDWLNNKFVVGLNAWIKGLPTNIRRTDPMFAFPRSVFLGWPSKHADICCLLEEFEQAMSPRVLFDSEPLCDCSAETKAWLPDLIDRLWHSRAQPWIRVFEIGEKAKCVDDAYYDLVNALGTGCDPLSDVSLLPRLQRLRDRAVDLNHAISEIPRKIEFV